VIRITVENTNDVTPQDINYTAIFIDDANMKKIRQAYSEDELSNKPKYPHITISYIGRNDNLDKTKMAKLNKQISQIGTEIKFKVVGYANDGENEAVQVELLNVPEELKDSLNSNTKYHITLSWSETSKPVKSGYLDFEPVDKEMNLTGVFGTIRKNAPKPVLK